MSELRRITKVRVKEDRVTIEYQVKRGGDKYDDYTLSCVDKPGPLLVLTLNHLAVYVADICELPPEKAAHIKVSGASFSYASDREGTTLIAAMALQRANCPLNLITPHLFIGDTIEDEKQLLSGHAADAVRDLKLAALRYLDGEREQLALPGMAPTAAEIDVPDIPGSVVMRALADSINAGEFDDPESGFTARATLRSPGLVEATREEVQPAVT